MHSVVSICIDAEKTADFTIKLLDKNGNIWWGLHTWKSEYLESGFIDSVVECGDSLEHWHKALQEYGLIEAILEDQT